MKCVSGCAHLARMLYPAIALDRVIKIATVPSVAIFVNSFDKNYLLVQSLILLVYSLLSGGRDSIFVRRIYSRLDYTNYALHYRIKTLACCTPFIIFYFISSFDVGWIEYSIVSILALLFGCFDIFDVKYQATDEYAKFLYLKTFFVIVLILFGSLIFNFLVVLAPYIFAPVYYLIKQNTSFRALKFSVKAKFCHLSKYFYGALLCIAGSKYELILSYVSDQNIKSSLNLALANRFADAIAFIFMIIVVRHNRTIASPTAFSKSVIDKIINFSFPIPVILLCIVLPIVKNMSFYGEQVIIGASLGICYGVGGLLSYVWSAINVSYVLLSIGFINICYLFTVAFPLYFRFAYLNFAMALMAGQIILTFIPYYFMRKKWLSL